MNTTLPQMPIGVLLMHRPDLAQRAVLWLLEQRLVALAAYPSDTDRNRVRRQRTRARQALAMATAQRTPLGLFWPMVGDALLASVNQGGQLELCVSTRTSENEALTNIMRRLVDASSDWRS